MAGGGNDVYPMTAKQNGTGKQVRSEEGGLLVDTAFFVGVKGDGNDVYPS